jgi:translocation and assembly module TamB
MFTSSLRIIVTTFFALILIALCLIAWFLFTTEGNKELIQITQYNISSLSVDTDDGNLIDSLALHSLSWSDNNISINAQTIKLKWNPLCLLAKSICAEQLHIKKLSLNLPEKEKPQNKTNDELVIGSVALPINIDIDDVFVEELIINNGTNNKPITINNIFLQAYTNNGQLIIERLAARYQTIFASVSGNIDLDNALELDLKLDVIAESIIQGEDLLISSDIYGNLDQLQISASTFGPINTSLKASANVLLSHIPSTMTLSWKNINWPISSTPTLSLSNGQLQLKGSLNEFKTTFETHYSGEKVPTGDASIVGKLNLKAFIAEEVNIKTLDGEIQGQADLKWADGITWSTNLFFTELNPYSINPEFPGKLDGNLLLTGSANKKGDWLLDIQPAVIQGTLRGEPIHLHAKAKHTLSGHWQLDSLYLKSKKNQIDVMGSISDQWALKGNINVQSLAQIVPDASGQIKGDFKLSGALLSPNIDLQVTSNNMQWKDYSASKVQLTSHMVKLGQSKSILNLSAKTITANQQTLSNSSIKLHGTQLKHTLNISSAGPKSTHIKSLLTGSLDKKHNWNGELKSTILQLPSHLLRLQKPLSVRWTQHNQALFLSAHCWQSGASTLCLENDIINIKDATAKLSLSNYSLSKLNSFMPEKSAVQGKLNLESTLLWGSKVSSGFNAELKAKITDGGVSTQHKSNDESLEFLYQTIDLNASINQSKIATTLNIKSTTLGHATIDVNLNPSLKPLLLDGTSIDIAGFDIGFLNAFFPDINNIEGKVFAKGVVKGELNKAQFFGKLELKDPVVSTSKLPIEITGGHLTTQILGHSATLLGKIQSGNGTINLKGNANWQIPENWFADINVSGSSLVFSQKPLIESVFAPNISIKLKPNQAIIKGKVDVLAAAINIKEIPEGVIEPSADIIIEEERLDEQKAGAQSPWSVKTELNINLGDAVRLSGYGLRAQLSGDFSLIKNNEKPLQFLGEITIPTGVYKSYGQDLKVEQGQVLLVGAIDQSLLNIEAYREVEDVRAGLAISGTIAKPVINLYSDPFMEQERVLAYIVLGRDISAGEDNDSNILATAALSMGISNGRGIATNIAEAIGIREFNIEASGRGEDTQVLLSGRLSPRLLIRYGVGVFTPVNTLFLRYELGKRLYLETAQGVESAVDIFYSIKF